MVPPLLVRSTLFLGLLGPGLAAAAETGPAQPRELLQPPQELEANPINDRFALRGIYYQPRMDTVLRNDRSLTEPGTEVSAEDTLGMDDELNQGTIEMMIRLQPRHRLRADYLKFTRTGDAVMDELIIFGDNNFFPGERVVSEMDLRTLGLTYAYSIFRRERWELGLGLGVHLIEIKGEAGVPARFVSEEFDAAGPFATAEIDGTWLITKRFSFNARAQYMTAASGETDGSLGKFHADVQFRASPNLAFGLGYTLLTMKVDSSEVDDSGLFDFEASGPEAFVRVSF